MVAGECEFRFYEELNDFLAPERRKQEFSAPCARAATVKHMIEALGVPHTEVELILVNGESAGFERLLAEGDRVSVYPKFEALDVTPLLPWAWGINGFASVIAALLATLLAAHWGQTAVVLLAAVCYGMAACQFPREEDGSG